MSASIRETFHLEQYTEEAVDDVVNWKTRFETCHLPMGDELKKKHNLTDADISKILSNTFLVWGH